MNYNFQCYYLIDRKVLVVLISRISNVIIEMKKDIFQRLSKSKFRSSFKLKDRELEYYREKGHDEILNHPRDFIIKRLAPAEIANDGKQTPFRNHPVFIAQHAKATCCRGCLQKWHGIEKRRELTPNEIEFVVELVGKWLENNS